MKQFEEKKFDIEESINDARFNKMKDIATFLSIYGNSGVADIVKKDDLQKHHINEAIKQIEKKDIKIVRTPTSVLKKISPESMFHYTVWCGDYNLSGLNWDSEYTGTNRNEALNAIKRAKDWMGMSKVCIEVLGRKEKRKEEKIEWDEDWMDDDDYDYYICPGFDFI